MVKHKYHISLAIAFLISISFSFATHIVGGELYYRYLGNSKYRVTLKLYRDCINGQVPFSGQGEGSTLLSVFDKNNEEYATFPLGEPVITKVPATTNIPCIKAPNGVCVEEGVYTTTITLPPKAGGYFLKYGTCCRNTSILNLVNPGTQGSTYTAFVPGPELAAVNSSPRFNTYPSIFVCQGKQIYIDHSATDADGDELVYSLCPAFNGFPDTLVTYKSPYSSNYPMSATQALTVHPTTGLITGIPNLQGNWVVCVCVKEYRNGKLLSTHYRDFQFNVISCAYFVKTEIANQIKKCNENTINFTNLSFSNFGLNYLWDFGVNSVTTDTSTKKDPTFTYPDTGTYVVTLITNPGLPCADTAKKTFYAYPKFEVNYSRPISPQCLKNSNATYSVNGVYSAVAQFTFNFGGDALPSISNQTLTQVSFLKPGNHIVKITGKQHVCVDSLIDTLRIIDRPKAIIGNLPDKLCAPVTITFSNQSISEYLAATLWELNTGNIYTSYNAIHTFSDSGTYNMQLTLLRYGICPDTSIAIINPIKVYPSPKAEFNITPTLTTIFEPEIFVENTSTTPFVNFVYFFGDGITSNYINEKHSYVAPGTYQVTQLLINEFGCESFLTKEVIVNPEFRCWVPNTFTPDDNGLNDTFHPIVIGLKDYTFEVFSLNGQKIFSTNDPTNGWDGKVKDKKSKQDTYVWLIKFTNELTGKAETKTGHVTLIGSQE
ncbi:MAG: PKD domain-containing protein [Bacteroidia bacterium]|nr:PKD domain-containing protein [Bacteroidia bacterium]